MRCEGWPRKLNEYLVQRQDLYQAEGFTWGKTDCVHFVADWVQLLTGTDPLGDLRNAYGSEKEALKLLRDKEGTLLEALTARFGAPVHPAFAQRGDVAYIQLEGMESCGILLTSGSLMRGLFPTERGFTLQRYQDCLYAFRIE
jgi:hypothetical protein